MKTSKYNQLAAFVASPFSVSGIRANSQESYMLKSLLEYGRVRTGYYRGTGRYKTAVDLTQRISSILTQLGIAHECQNDAPRGGVSGNVVVVTMPAFCKEVKRLEAERTAQREATLKAYKEHQEWVDAEAAKLDLEPYRDEITRIYQGMGNTLPTSDNYNYLSKKARGKVVWTLIHSHKGLNAEVLTAALRSYKLVKF